MKELNRHDTALKSSTSDYGSNLLNTNITYLKGVGPKRSALYKKLSVLTVWDLLRHYPRRYVDYNDSKTISEAEIGETCVVKCTVIRKLPVQRIRAGMTVYKVIATDFKSDITIVIYNNETAYNKLVQDKVYLFLGKITGTLFRKELNSPEFIPDDNEIKIIPRYNLTAGLTNNMVQKNVREALSYAEANINDPLSKEIRDKFDLYGLIKAINKIHFPKSNQEFEDAKKRIAFEELLLLQLGLKRMKERNRSLTGAVMQDKSIDDFYKQIPFELTNAQKRSISECILDMQKEIPMSRLLQGDVGSGKTAVAAALCYFAYLNKVQTAMLAPTEILAMQHYNTLCSFLQPLGIETELLTGSVSAKNKKIIKQKLENGHSPVVVGTHALLQENTQFLKLGLVITDEQHRFGVSQRSVLLGKGDNPHMLVMSATPIPRTLALMIYGDLDLSVLDEMPKGRKPIETYSVDTSFRPRLYKFIENHVKENKQAYIVCPAIDENENGMTAVKKYYEDLKNNVFTDISVGLLHGKMKASDKEKIMNAFLSNEISVLVTTTVIEVGVDVPNSVVMMIENSERFGLSQLHQLRGRVGRGKDKSYCILVTDSKSEESKLRMEIMKNNTDGFEIANKDLEMRGPGDFFGMQQHGLPNLKMADMSHDIELMKKVQELAFEILEKDSELKNPENKHLREAVEELFNREEHIFN